MTDEENRSIITLALMAAFADGDISDVERAEVKRVGDSRSRGSDSNVAAI